MKNITLAIDEALLNRTRVFAAEQGISVNQLVRDLLARAVGEETPRQHAARMKLVELAKNSKADFGPDWKWNREDIYAGRLSLDTNVLLYAVTTNPTEMAKRARAIEVMQEQPFGLSGQVLAEFYDRATQAKRGFLTPDEALEWLAAMADQPCVPVDHALVEAGVQMSQRCRISYWDGAIVAAAERLGAGVLYSEDLNHGQSYGSVRVINPFLN